MSSVSGPGRSPGEGNGNPLQYSCLGNPMDRGAWSAAVHGVSQSQTWLSDQQEIFFIMNRIYLYSFKESKGTKSFFFFLNLQHRINGQWLIFFFSVFFIFWLQHVACGISISWSWIGTKHSALDAWIIRHWAIREIPIFFSFFFKWMQRHRIMVTIGFYFFFFYKCFRISKAYTHLISHLSLKLSCWAGRADVSGFAPSFWEGGSDGANDLLSIAQLQKAVLRPFTKLSNSPS